MKNQKTIISSALNGHEHAYRFERNSRLPLSTFRKPSLLTPDEWVVFAGLLCALIALIA